MEPQTASVYSSSSVPRLRVTRRPSSTASSGLPPVKWATDPKRSSSYSDSQATSEDESGTLSLAEVTPRLLSASLPPPDSTTVSGDTVQRLRAVLDRFETSLRGRTSTSHSLMPPSPSEPESDFDVPPAQAARASIKILLQNALREPGDTPQKPKLTRRASFNVVGSPKISKARRKSTSDEENDSLAKSHDNRRFDPSTAASLDRLRLQLNESMSSIQATSFGGVTSHTSSQATASTATKAASSHHVRVPRIPVVNSPIKQTKSHKDLEPFATASVADSSPIFPQHNHSNHAPGTHTQEPPSSFEDVSHPTALATITRHHNHDAVSASRMSSTQSDADYRQHLRAFQQETDIEREADWNRRHPPHHPPRASISNGHLHSSTNNDAGHVSPGTRPAPPPSGTSPSRIRSPKHSLTRREGELSDGHSSRGTSTSSNAEHRDRQKESEQERQHDLERNWSRPHQQNYKSTPLQRVSGAHSQDHSPPSGPANEHIRADSRVGHDFARSPSPSSSRPDDEKLEKQHEIEHERERNWNAPRPKWGQHPHHTSDMNHHHFPRASSPLPSYTFGTDKDHTTVHSRHSTSSLTPMSFSVDEHSHSRPHSRLQHHVNDDGENLRGGTPSSQTSSPSRQGEDIEELHERERNWNAPRPSWHQHAHHPTSGHEPGHHPSSRRSPHPSPRSDKEREQSWGRHRPNPSLELPVNRHSARSPSPTPLYRPHPSSRHNSSRAKSPAPLVHASEARQPGTNSSLPQFDNERDKENESEPSNRPDWDSPQVSPLQTLSKTERTESTLSNPISMPPARPAPHEVVHQPALQTLVSTAELVLVPDIKKGHRRTVTQLSEAMGPFPRKNTLPPSIAKSDEESYGSLFADESVPPPRMSTPTYRASHLPDLSISPAASDIPLPPSPPSPIATCDPPVRADSDLARLQRAVAQNFTFPARQPSPPQPLALSTPPPRASNAQRTEFKTPSPPLGLPDLPDPPSSDEEARTSSKTNGHVDPPATSVSLMKTPRFPGAFATPDPPASKPIVGHALEGDASMSWKEVDTTPKLEPVDTAPRFQPQSAENANDTLGSSPVPVTPAPPGAYRATPAQSKPKGILKVRFDGDVQSSGLANGTGSTVNGVMSTRRVISPPPSPSSEDVPLLSLSPSRRKGLRLVDEYGRARRFTQDGEEIILDSRRKANAETEGPDDISSSKVLQVADATMTPRRRGKMRQVDAIGNDIAVAQRQPNGEVHQIKPGRKATFLRLTRSLGDLKHTLAEEEEALTALMPQGSLGDDERLMNLALVSKTARIERNRLSRRLQLERHGEGGINDNTVYAAHSPTLSPSETLIRVSWWRRKWRIFLFLLILELVVLCVGYRLASIHAKQAWLTTHYDPFFPALYLRKTPPSFISRFGTLPMDWSAFAISGAVQRVGVRGFVEGVGKQLWEGIWSWRMGPWEGAWGSPAAGPPAPRTWPPS